MNSPALSALLARIGALSPAGRCALVAVDGMAASGKTTLAAELAQALPGCFVVHMDDFTIPLDRRESGHFERALSNADVERFDREVLSPLRAGQAACYRPYVCHPDPGFLSPVTIPQDARVVVVEGAYCLHDRLFDRYDLRALMTIAPHAQKARILRRNGEARLAQFLDAWIPMENRHIEARDLLDRCDLVIKSEG